MAPDEPDRPGPAPAPESGEATDETAARPEPRAKDLIGRSREELEEQLDPRTLAELASWFVRPSRVEVEEAIESRGRFARNDQLDPIAALGMSMGVLDIEESTAQKEAREAAMAAVEPRMVDLLERHERTPERLVKPRPDVKFHVDDTVVPRWIRSLLETDEDGGPRVAEARVLQRSPDIDALLDNDNAPQAVLRDLHRPEETFDRRLEPAFPPPPPEEDMTFAIRDALRWRPEPLPRLERALSPRAEWGDVYTGPWAELVPAARDARQAEADAAAADDPGFGFFFFGQR